MKKIQTGKVSVCSPDKSFFASDGKVFKSLADLAAGVQRMHPDTFKHHANKEKNDFSNWVRDVFGEQQLADLALNARSQKHLAQMVYARLRGN